MPLFTRRHQSSGMMRRNMAAGGGFRPRHTAGAILVREDDARHGAWFTETSLESGSVDPSARPGPVRDGAERMRWSATQGGERSKPRHPRHVSEHVCLPDHPT
jgi:hypothetical protein